MKGGDNEFYFNQKIVCVRFLKKAFRFSTVLVERSRSLSFQTDQSLQTDQHSMDNGIPITTSTCVSANASIGSRLSPQKDAIISFLLRLSEDCSDRMPDNHELHLPFFQKKEVYQLFLNEYKKLYTHVPPTPHYFYKT